MSMTTSDPAGSLRAGYMLHEYRIERVLGHGGFGITYLAHDTHLDKTVAIKEYLPTDLAVRGDDRSVTPRGSESKEAFQWGLDNFLKEARMLARFSHANLILVHRFFEDNGTAYFVMEYAEGTTLSAELRESGTLTEARIRNVLLPVMAGLEQVHREGVLHRDIKPDNIILRKDGSPVLIDFGAARQNLGSMTRSVMSVLTAGYAPLEQYASSGNQGPWTDLYALGAVAYRALSGRKPPEAVNRVREDPMVPARLAGAGRYSPNFLHAVDWALEISPEDRPGSIVEFRQALEGQRVPPTAHAPGLSVPKGPEVDPTLVLPKAGVKDSPVSPTVVMSPGGGPAQARATGISGLTQGLRSLPPTMLAMGGAILILATLLLWLVMRPGAPPEEVADATPAGEQHAVEPATGAAAEPEPADPQAQAEPPATETESEPAPAAPVARKKPVRKPEPRMQPVAAMAPRSTFRDCPGCPEMVVLPAGTFQMGAARGTAASWEGPLHAVRIARPFAIGRHEVTVAEWNRCVKAGGCASVKPGPSSGDPARAPVVNVTWAEAQAYARWLSADTGRGYRLPSEAEWEYAVRAGTTTSRYWSDDRSGQCQYANGADQSALSRNAKLQAIDCDDGYPALAPVGSFKPNAFGLFDVAGNAWEWTLDCWFDSYRNAPTDGSAADAPNCSRRVIRGGSWLTKPESLRSSNRGVSYPDHRGEDLGLRVVAE